MSNKRILIHLLNLRFYICPLVPARIASARNGFVNGA